VAVIEDRLGFLGKRFGIGRKRGEIGRGPIVVRLSCHAKSINAGSGRGVNSRRKMPRMRNSGRGRPSGRCGAALGERAA